VPVPVKQIAHYLSKLGATGAASYVLLCALKITGRVRPRGVGFPLTLRRNSSDAQVFKQVFVEQEYAPLCDLQDVQLVIDCGAYVGCSTTYFVSTFRHCEVIAVEPDEGNFWSLAANVAP